MVDAPDFWWRPLWPLSPGALAALALAPLGWLYGAVAGARMGGAGAEAPVPVVCVGNFIVGGAGKTPVAMAVAHIAKAMGRNPAFLSRGYGGALPGPVVVELGVHTAGEVGDEPLLLAQIAPTIVARDRAEGARRALSAGADFLIMDDGFQSPSIIKDISIVVVDGGRGIGNGLCLPAGPLRAPLARQMRAADAVLVLGEGAPGRDIAHHAARQGRALIAARLEPVDPPELAGRKVLAFAGIGRPDKFFDTVRGLGAEIVAARAFADHHPYTDEEAAELVKTAVDNDLLLVTTEKDRARLADQTATQDVLAEQSTVVAVKVRFEDRRQIERLIGRAIERASLRLK